MIKQILKFNNKCMNHLQLLRFRHFTDYVGMKRIYVRPDYDVYAIELKNANYFTVKVVKND